jgi:hypothetical protein
VSESCQVDLAHLHLKYCAGRIFHRTEHFLASMAPRASVTSTRSLLELFHPTRRRPTGPKLNPLPRNKPSAFSKNVSTTAAPQQSEMEVDTEARPRWSYTPTAMAAPVRSRLPRREQPWKVNDDPKMLDSFYVRFLGPGGERMLTDETKWLAITHKSFDHGRRGFNDRLSYLGTLATTQSPRSTWSNWLGVMYCRQTYRRASDDTCASRLICEGRI